MMIKLMRMVVLCVVLALSLTIGAYAAESSPLSIEAEDVSAASTELTIRVRLPAPVTDGVFRFHYDTAELNGPAGAEGLSAGAKLPAGQIKAAFVYDETGAAGDTVLECRFQITGTARTFTFTADGGALYQDGQSVACPAVSAKVRLPSIVDPGKPSQPAEPKKGFDDVKPGDWFYNEVTDLAGKGYINGVSDTLFAPDRNLSRGMLVTILWRMEGKPVVNLALQYADVTPEAYYTEALRCATAAGTFALPSPTSVAANWIWSIRCRPTRVCSAHRSP